MTTELATFASGCFWSPEYYFAQLDGVVRVTSGYIGGTVDNPTYEQVCSGTTNHAEAVEVEFDPNIVSYEQLLDVFWAIHDPTQLNRQGPDMGTQYRTAIFTHSEEQRQQAITSRTEEQTDIANPIVTEITEAGTFYPAEDYHQNFIERTGRHCHPPRRKYRKISAA